MRRSRSTSTAAGAFSKSARAPCLRAASSPPIPTSPSASRRPRRWREPTRRWSGACESAPPSCTEVNQALAVAKRKADEANLDKTRFLAAASHDVLQPLNAARLYVTSLVERSLGGQEATLAGNIDASLEAVEEILGVLIEISRLDAGRLEPDITVFPLNEVFERLKVEFAPLAREKALDLRIVATQPGCARTAGCCAACCRTSSPMPSSIRRRARCCSACAGAATGWRSSSCDTGPGIPQIEAHDHLQGIRAAGGDGKRRAGPRSRAVDRRAHRQGARSPHRPAVGAGRGSTFSVELPRAEPRVAAEPGTVVAAIGRADGRARPCCASTMSPPSCAACRRCSRAGDAAC